MWYNKQVRCQAGRESQSEAGGNKNRKIGERETKELEKTSEKPLDKLLKMWYNRKACKLTERYSGEQF